MDTGSIKLPGIAITETGVPSNVDQTRGLGEYHILAQSIGLGKELVPNNVPLTSLWTLYDNMEWGSGYSPCFGVFRSDGTNKPEATLPPEALNLASASVIIELNKHIIVLRRYRHHVEILYAKTPTHEQRHELEKQIGMVSGKISLTESLLRGATASFIDI
jgi:hypothetical protein